MTRLTVVALLLCVSLAGCAGEQERVQQTGQPVNLLPSRQEQGLRK